MSSRAYTQAAPDPVVTWHQELEASGILPDVFKRDDNLTFVRFRREIMGTAVVHDLLCAKTGTISYFGPAVYGRVFVVHYHAMRVYAAGAGSALSIDWYPTPNCDAAVSSLLEQAHNIKFVVELFLNAARGLAVGDGVPIAHGNPISGHYARGRKAPEVKPFDATNTQAAVMWAKYDAAESKL